MSNPKYSIIITNTNNGEYLDLCLKSFLDNTKNLEDKEVVVFNNACSDDSNDICRKWMKKFNAIHCLESRELLNLAMITNASVSYSAGEILFIVNEDVVFPKDWESNLSLFEKLSKRNNMMLCCNLVEPGRHIPVATGFTQKDLGTNPKEFDYEEFLKFEKKNRSDKIINASNGPQILYKKHYMMVGGYDPLFLGGCVVDPDFFIKLQLAGLVLLRSYNSAFYHFSGKSGRLKDKNPNPNAFNEIESLNLRKFHAKWGFLPRADNGLWVAPKTKVKGVDFE